MAHKFLHIGCVFTTFPKTAAVDFALNSSGDHWIRYAANNWIIWTERSALDWFTTLRPALGLDDQVLIVELNAHERNGWLSNWIWEWIDKKLKGQTDTLQAIINQLYPFGLPPPTDIESAAPMGGKLNALNALLGKKKP